MQPRDRLLAVTVAILWGLNFIAIDFSLEHFPPFFLAGLRFLVLAIPTILFVPQPKVPWKWLIGYGLGFGTLQFAFLFLALKIGMPAGLASLVLQASAPFTVILGAALLRERISPLQICGVGIAVLGMAVIGWHRAQTAAILPVILTLCGALGWALGNLCSRKANPPNPLHMTMWMSVFPPLPMFVLSAIAEGPATGWKTVGTAFSSHEGLVAVGGLLYTMLLATILGSGIWTTLMRRYPASVVSPFSLLVPVVGFTAAWAALGERPAAIELIAGAVVVGGVLLASLKPHRRAKKLTEEPLQPAAVG